MNVEYIREQSGNYMRILGEKQTDCYEMKMVECNEIEGLLPLTIRKVNNQSVYLYRISNMICMKDMYECRLQTGKDIRSFLESLKAVLKSLREYLLRPDGLMIDSEHIFMDRDSGKAYFIYFENEEGDFFAGLKHLYEDCILQCVDHTDNEAVALVYGTYKRLCGNNCSIQGLFEVEASADDQYRVQQANTVNPHVLPERISEEEEVPDKRKTYMVYAAFGGIGLVFIWSLLSALLPILRISGTGTFFYVVFLIASAVGGYLLFRWYKENRNLFTRIIKKNVNIPYEKEHIRIEIPGNKQEMAGKAFARESGENTDGQEEPDSLEDEGKTMVLNAETFSEQPVLRWQVEEKWMEYPVLGETMIGSSAKNADCVIKLPGISRMHAKLLCADGMYLLKDMNSTNGTKVDGIQLSSFQLFPLKESSEILLGNQRVEFRMKQAEA